MSKINYTPNLGLITYSGEVIPTYLADTTRNMEILDNVVGKLNTENPSIDARLETLEDDVQKVMSTQHVQIAKFTAYQVATDARLDKLEKDVSDISPEGIQDIRDRLTNAEADIQSNSAVTQALTERVSGDEGVIANNTARIDVLELQFGEGGEYDFSALEDKVTTLGDDVSRIDSELDSLTSEVTGADGLQKKLEILNGEVDALQVSNTTQANQIESLGNQTDNLEERVTNLERGGSGTPSTDVEIISVNVNNSSASDGYRSYTLDKSFPLPSREKVLNLYTEMENGKGAVYPLRYNPDNSTNQIVTLDIGGFTGTTFKFICLK